jgi:hypothetical protein
VLDASPAGVTPPILFRVDLVEAQVETFRARLKELVNREVWVTADHRKPLPDRADALQVWTVQITD